MPKKKAHPLEPLLAGSADPVRARHFWSALQEQHPEIASPATAESAAVLIALFSGSQALSEAVLADPAWFLPALQPDGLEHPRQLQGMRREIEGWLSARLKARDYAGALTDLRRFKAREMVRVAARDLTHRDSVENLIREISDIADVVLESVYRICWQQLTEKLGTPYYETAEGSWAPAVGAVLGMGKLGGQELNYSSDVDVLVVYSEEGQLFKTAPSRRETGGRGLANHPFFNRLAELLISEVSRLTPEGSLYRIDLRLRPEGQSGPLTRSLAGYENYYAQWGQSWERMMLIKARGVAGDRSLAAEFLETVQPFRYPRFLGEGVVREVAAMKSRIEQEVVRAGELDRNVKLGRGGIREIEFIAQTLQLLHAGRIPFLQGAQTLPVLKKLAEYRLLSDADAEHLTDAYRFLRQVEHRLQMEEDRQTHTIPTDRKARERLARLMGFETLLEFEQRLKTHMGRVRSMFEQLLQEPGGGPEGPALPPTLEGEEARWKELLQRHRFRDPERAFRLLQEFVQGPGYVHVSQRTVDLARQLVPRLLAFCPKGSLETGLRERKGRVLSDPDRVLARLDSFISAYGTRAMLYETWTRNPSIFELLLLLFDRSEFLAETAIRTPDMVDELVVSGRLRRRKSAPEILQELRYGARDADQKLWVRQYHQTELMRIGLRDILELADYEQNLAELSALADAAIQYSLEAVMRKHRLRQPPFAVIGLGKLGGEELNYGSDLDLMFVTAAPASELPRMQRWALDLMELLSEKTEHGWVFVTDARLRPDGEKGLIVNNLAAYGDYYRKRALLWEIQSISRNRFLAGDATTGAAFQALVRSLADFRPDNVRQAFAGPGGTGLAAYAPDWKQAIARMRLRIESERTPPGKNALAIKTGTGGLMDAEFLAQAFALEHGWMEANTLRGLQRALEEGFLETGEGQALITHYRQLRRVEAILRRWSFEGETVLPEDPEPLYRVSVRCGWPGPEAFMEAVGAWRAGLRESFQRYFGLGAQGEIRNSRRSARS